MVPPALDTPERAIVAVVNQERAALGLPTLRTSSALSRTADAHTAAMVRAGSLTHQGFGARASGRASGEALAFASGRAARARTFLRMWLQSPPHRALLTSGTYSRIGVGRRRGTIGGVRGTVVTLELARG